MILDAPPRSSAQRPAPRIGSGVQGLCLSAIATGSLLVAPGRDPQVLRDLSGRPGGALRAVIDAMKSVAIGTTAGIVAPPLFAAVVLAQDLLRPEFDPARRFISELAIGPLGWIQIANFLVLGAAIATFARTVAVECSGTGATHAVSTMLSVIGISVFASGVFVPDPATAPIDELTWHGIVHLIFGLTLFSVMPICCYLAFRGLSHKNQWGWFRTWTLLAVLVTGGFWIILIPGSFVPAFIETFGGWIGILNRIVFGTWLLWLFLFAMGVRRQRLMAGTASESE